MTATTQTQSPLSIFQNRNFSLLWIGQLVTEMGSSVTALAASIYIYRLTGSALNVGLMMMASAAPSLIIGLFAGVFVDRYDRKKIMLVTEIMRALVIFAIPFLLPYNTTWLYILVIISGILAQFFNPAHASVIPDIATEDELNAANSLMAVSSFGSLAIGYALAGVIAASYPIEWAFYIDAMTFVISGVVIYFVKVPKLPLQGKTNLKDVGSNLVDGFQIIQKTAVLRSLFIIFGLVFITYGITNAIRLPFTIIALNATELEFGILESISIIGFVAASLLMVKYGDRIREGQWIAISLVGMGITGIAFALTTKFSVALLIILIEGFLNAPSVIARTLVIQRNTPREALGRVFSAFFVMRDSFFMLGMALAGLADYIDVRIIYLVSSLANLLLGAAATILPGLGQPGAEWRRALQLLRSAPEAPGMGIGRGLTITDFTRLSALIPAISALPPTKINKIRTQMSIYDVGEGTAIIKYKEKSDAAYFILSGQVVVGREGEGNYKVLSTLREGDFFGEIAALTGMTRTANVITDRPTTLIKVPANTLREMSEDPELSRLFVTKMAERMLNFSTIDMALPGRLDQTSVRELRSQKPDLEPVVAE